MERSNGRAPSQFRPIEMTPGFHRNAAKTDTGRRLDRRHANCRKVDTVFLAGLFHLDQDTPGTVPA